MSKKPHCSQGVDCGQLAGLDSADYRSHPAIGESLHELAGQRAENFDARRIIIGNGEMLTVPILRPMTRLSQGRIIVNDESADAPGGRPSERDRSFLRQTLPDFIQPVGQALLRT